MIGLYPNPPEQAMVLCCDEKSQCQALEQTQPGLPLGIGRTATHTHDYRRHGTLTLFAELTQEVIRDGSFTHVKQLRNDIEEYIAIRNMNPKPYAWKAKGEEILRELESARRSLEAREEKQSNVNCRTLH